MKLTKSQIAFFFIFTLLGFLALQAPIYQIVGAKAKFTLFDFFGPLAGGFLGSAIGVASVLFIQIANFFVHGASLDAATIIRFFPMLFAVIYFSRRSAWILLVPVIALVGFVIHPIGRLAFVYSLFWLIPLLCWPLRRFPAARALGSTFTAHAVGSVAFLYIFKLPAAVWLGLIPVVFKERFIFAAGILVMYLIFEGILKLIEKKWPSLNFWPARSGLHNIKEHGN